MTVSNSGSCEANASSTSHKAAVAARLPPPVVTKKKRNLPGMPDPDAEVIALSPRTLMATNRFVCEICNKGFQRDQNLQLHRRGHNLPWKLRQRTSKEVKKRVYVCPEPSCVHHDSSRALGDLTGIKKHFCRKHGEKKWKCDKCSKKYAVQSDWKAHYKTCGTREYRCDCGTLFSRRDSFITHRAFCDALAEETAKVVQTNSSIAAVSGTSEEDPMVMVPSPPPVLQAPAAAEKKHHNELDSATNHIAPPPAHTTTTTTASLFASLFSSSAAPSPASTFADLMGAMSNNSQHTAFITLPTTSEMFGRETGSTEHRTLMPTSGFGPPLKPPPSPHMSATALLQKASQMGAAATNSSSLRRFGLSVATTASSASPTSQHQQQQLYHHQEESNDDFHENYQWRSHLDPHGSSSGLGLALPYNTIGGVCAGLPELSSLCVAKPATLDFLGLGMGPEGSGDGLSALISSIADGGGGRFCGGSTGSGSSVSNGNGNGNDSNNGLKRKGNSPALL